MSDNIVFTGFYIVWLLVFSTWLGVTTRRNEYLLVDNPSSHGAFEDPEDMLRKLFEMARQDASREYFMSVCLILGIPSGLAISLLWCRIFKTKTPLYAAVFSMFLFSFLCVWILSTPNIIFGAWVVY